MEKKKNLIIAHGDIDGVISAALLVKRLKLKDTEVKVIFTQPYLLDKIEVDDDITAVYVVDIAVNNRDPEMTRRFIERLGNRLVSWYDHHQGWKIADHRLIIDENAPSCAAIIAIIFFGYTEWVADWVADATAADTRKGGLSERGRLIEEAIKADLSDNNIRECAVRWLMNGCKEDSDYQKLQKAQAKYQRVQKMTERLAEQYEIHDGVAVVDIRDINEEYDRTQLLIKGEQMAPKKTVILLGRNLEGEEVITVATMDKKLNLVDLFGLPSGAPFRVSLPTKTGWTLEKIIAKLTQLS